MLRLFDNRQNSRVQYEIINEVSKGTNIICEVNYQDKHWFRKTILFDFKACNEVLAQEFFRLIMPYHPISFVELAESEQFVYTQKVDEFRPLPTNEQANYLNGTYTNLGQVLLCAMFLEEIDLTLDNIGLDGSNRVTKIDSEKCFAQIYGFNNDPFNLNQNILRLPFLVRSYATNWLDLIIRTKMNKNSSIVNSDFFEAPQFLNEKNHALLKICLLPESFIEQFVPRYYPAQHQENIAKTIQLIKQRKALLTSFALNNASFLGYIKIHGPQEIKAFITHLQNFKPYQQNSVVEANHAGELAEEVYALFNAFLPNENKIAPPPLEQEPPIDTQALPDEEENPCCCRIA